MPSSLPGERIPAGLIGSDPYSKSIDRFISSHAYGPGTAYPVTVAVWTEACLFKQPLEPDIMNFTSIHRFHGQSCQR